MALNKIYAGVGARETPDHMLGIMTRISLQLAETGWMLRSGNARGADQAFQKGAPTSRKEIHLPWDGYNNARTSNPSFIVPKPTQGVVDIAAQFHPAWDSLSVTVKLFMCRNVTIVLGEHLDNPVNMIICWTPHAKVTGGTGHALRIAPAYGIPIFNLADPSSHEALINFVNEIDVLANDPTVPVR